MTKYLNSRPCQLTLEGRATPIHSNHIHIITNVWDIATSSGWNKRQEIALQIVREALAWPDGQLQPCLQVEKGHRAMLEFLTDDAFGFQTGPSL